MAGPLFTRKNKKSWILMFTCAAKRAGFFQLLTSASTHTFMTFRRFLDRKDKFSTANSDNGFNFVETNSYLKQLDYIVE